MQARVLVSVFANFLTGAITGLLGGLVMALLDYLSQLAWGQQVLRGFPSQAPVVWQFLLPLITGLAIGLLRRAGAQPLPELHVTLAQLRQTNEQQQSLDLSFRGSHLLLGLLALVGGGSLGPEAMLSRMLAEINLNLKRVQQSISPKINLIKSRWSWLAALLGGIAGFALTQGFNRFGGGEQGVAFIWPQSPSQAGLNLLWALVLGLLGGCLGLLFLGLRQQLSKQWKRFSVSTLNQALFAGLVLALVNIWQPLALFSGEQQLSPLLQGALMQGPGALLLLGLLKIGLCALCLESGWVGGLFFPLIIGAAAIASGLHQALGIIPNEVAVSALVASIQAAILAQPLVPLFVTVAVLKGHALPAALLGSLVGWQLGKQGKKTTAQP